MIIHYNISLLKQNMFKSASSYFYFIYLILFLCSFHFGFYFKTIHWQNSKLLPKSTCITGRVAYTPGGVPIFTTTLSRVRGLRHSDGGVV